MTSFSLLLKYFRYYRQKSFLPPDWEHNDDIIVAVVKILVAEDTEDDDDVEDDDEGGDGRVSGHPGPGHAPLLCHLKWDVGDDVLNWDVVRQDLKRLKCY